MKFLWFLYFLFAHSRAVTVDIVVAICREQNVQFLDAASWALQSAGFDVATRGACMCGEPRPLRCTTHLKNSGREAHAFVQHVVARRHALADITLFLNGGAASKPPALADVTATTAAVAKHGLALWYADAQAVQLERPATRLEPRETALAWHFDSVRRCSNESACCDRCAKSWCCHAFGVVCPNSQARVFDELTDCRWHGATPENRDWSGAGLTDGGALAPASPRSFDLWLHQRWGVHVEQFEELQWRPYGIFAASKNALLAHSNVTYARALRELESAGASGGVVAHFYERAWRSLFV